MSEGVSRLKELLFDAEAQRLAALSTRVDAVFERAGSDDRLLHSVAGIIDGALREAEVNRHEQLSGAVAPLVIKTIKRELKNSEAEMVDALYPITGKLVAQYVRAAISDMMVDINRRLGGGGLSRLEILARERGVSVAELMLSETQKLAAEEIFLIRRGSGTLIGHWERNSGVKPAAAEGNNRDALIAGYLSGILRFSQEAFNDTGGSLRTLDLDGQRIALRASQAYILAARIAGSAPAAVEQAIDATFLETLNRDRDKLATGDANGFMPEIAATLDQRLDAARSEMLARLTVEHERGARPRFTRLYVFAALIAVPLLVWLGSTLFDRWEMIRTESDVRKTIVSIAEASGYPIEVKADAGGRSYVISGLLPSEGVRQKLHEKLRNDVGRAEARDQIAILPQPADVGPSLAGLRADLAKLDFATVQRSVQHSKARIGEVRIELARLEQGRLSDRVRTSLPGIQQDLAMAETTADQIMAAINAGGATPEALRTPIASLATRVGSVERALQAAAGNEPSRVMPQFADAGTQSTDALLASERLGGLVRAVRLNSEIADLSSRVAALTVVPTARDLLVAWMRANAIFFANGVDLRDEDVSSRQLDELARLLKQAGTVVRVVGYTDERGTQVLNTGLATQRADRVAGLLVDRGVPRDQLLVLGRTTGFELSRESGPTSTTRRVEFELTFVGEAGR